ncbi:MAG: 6-carboxytetrahydropterin synthase [Clostridium sp.]|nr:6-carboxytetrahydropterin synthase [Clostridium sp.]MCM1386361.1 6-carboxytetrahydropterin synthase [Bacillus sp. (in: firmicutes)]MCM1426102.1 6-carboxytetrahydropterin synthase [Eubacterium sp.]
MEKAYRQYKFKFYLNMNHYIIIDDKPGEVHPHTWEIILSVISAQSDMTPFANIERKMDEIMEQYQDKLLNECKPFDSVVPTVENAAKYFFRLIQDNIIQEGWILMMLEVSETPTRSYIINALFDEDDIWDEWYDNLTRKNMGLYGENRNMK